MGDKVKLTEAQNATLREMRSYSGGPYWFRQATCRELVGLGLARPQRAGLKRPPHEITEAGRAALAQAEKE